jgi:hypothetical protein
VALVGRLCPREWSALTARKGPAEG